MRRKLPTHLRFVTETPEGGNSDGGVEEEKAVDPVKAEDQPLGDAGLKALQAERERANKAEKAARDAQAALAAERDAAKAVQAQVDAAKAETDAAKAQALRYEVAIAEGLPATLAGRLLGATREELVADAKALKDSMITPSTFIPAVDPTQGMDRGGHSGGTVESGRERFRKQKNTSGR
nr:MAG TPA_asm: Major head protein [Caudoviricetes sp.]